ncbi:glycosyltransferase [Chloroflexota bacterium]
MKLNKQRIAILSVHSCPVGTLGTKDTGGMSVYIREVARKLGEQGNIVEVFTRTHDPRDKQIYELGENARLIHLAAGENEQIDKLAVYPYLPDFIRNIEAFRKQNGLDYDLLFSHYWLSGPVGEYLAECWKIPNVITFHTLGAVKNAIGLGDGEPELRITTEKKIAQNSQRIIASTEKEKTDIIRHYDTASEKIVVVPCGVNLGQFRITDREDARQHLGIGNEKIILFVGRIDPLKGINKLVEAASYLRDRQDWRLMIIGGGENSILEINKLKKLAVNLGISDRVTFSGLIKHNELPYYYSASDVCVMPSYYESFGLVALESLACGTPVIANNVGALRDTILDGKTGYVVPDNNVPSLIEKIKIVLDWPKSPGRANEIRESVAEFGWDKVAAGIIHECRRDYTSREPILPAKL